MTDVTACTIAVVPSAQSTFAVAEKLATALQVPCVGKTECAPEAFDLIVAVTEAAIEIRDGARPERPGYKVDFGAIDRRTGAGNLSRKQPIGRAVGEQTEHVFDATAGFGHDAARLCAMGMTVTAVERSPVVHALLEDGRRRALDDPELACIFGGLTVLHGEADDVLAGLETVPQVVYLDPMYPPNKKAALPPKPAQLLRQLVPPDVDSSQTLARAQALGVRRIVVKRPHRAPPIAPSPSHTITSKLVRYDVYMQP